MNFIDYTSIFQYLELIFKLSNHMVKLNIFNIIKI